MSGSRIRARTRAVLAVALVACGVACSDGTGPVNSARIRVINSVFQGNDIATAAPVAVDLFMDDGSVALTAAAAGITSGAPFAGASAGVHATTPVGGYTGVPVGTHRFTARIGGVAGTELFTTTAVSADDPSVTETRSYVPTQYLTPFPYTLIVAGVVPSTGLPDPSSVPFTLIPDDPFTPPADPAGGLTARIQVINAAPYADPSGNGATITASLTGTGAPIDLSADYRASSGYANPPAGTYVVTVSVGSTAVYTGSLTLAKGEVGTLVVQSTGFAATPSAANTKVTFLVDNQF